MLRKALKRIRIQKLHAVSKNKSFPQKSSQSVNIRSNDSGCTKKDIHRLTIARTKSMAHVDNIYMAHHVAVLSNFFRRSSTKLIFLYISQNSRENICTDDVTCVVT